MIGMIGKYLYTIGKEAGEKRERNLLSLLEKNENAAYLDCGCYTGKLTLEVAKKIQTKKVFGIDIDDWAIKESKKKGINVVKGDLNEKLPFQNNTFDVITAVEVIEHLHNTDMFVKELFRVTKKGGYVVIATENLASWHNIFALALGMQPSTGPHISSYHPVFFHPLFKEHKERAKKKEKWFLRGHINVLTRDAFYKVFRAYGFVPEEERLSGFYPFPGFLSDVFSQIDKKHALTILVKFRKL